MKRSLLFTLSVVVVILAAWETACRVFGIPDFILPPVRSKTRTIVTIHDLSFARVPDCTMPGMAPHLHRWVPYSVRQADHVIAVSEATRQDLIELYQTQPDKISVLYHGVASGFKPSTKLCEVY